MKLFRKFLFFDFIALCCKEIRIDPYPHNIFLWGLSRYRLKCWRKYRAKIMVVIFDHMCQNNLYFKSLFGIIPKQAFETTGDLSSLFSIFLSLCKEIRINQNWSLARDLFLWGFANMDPSAVKISNYTVKISFLFLLLHIIFDVL